ncbi:Endonuclease III-like protein [Theileria parva strain Muguga]|uniref:Endonuclease III homolog n=1 Tax=Theileria parva TaxID=5875 RepID=Q4N0H4_THEPA|nr:Endonuclease III-like protein [Theileria parva strain Muguga]EAN30897.1 Endonuclease III-like protein [Theileria parva strain Muguga]|eukprot:XP_763180.1 endonuclease III [Theileria parva strain Muguga]
MKICFLKFFLKILALFLLTLQSFVKALSFLKFTPRWNYGWVAPRFFSRNYVVDIFGYFGKDVDMAVKKPAKSETSSKTKIQGLKTQKHQKELENLTAKDHLDNILNTKSELKNIFKHKRTLKISYEDDLPEKRLTKTKRDSKTDDFNVEEIIKSAKSESSDKAKHEKVEHEQLDSKTEDEKVNNFPIVEEGVCSIPNFTKVWNCIANKRNKEIAPVDLYGCHCVADPGEHFEFQTLVGCMLSSQTKDEITALTMKNLKKRGLTLDNILKMDEEELDSIISKVGFHKTKAKNIKKAAQILKDQYGGKVPSNKKDLESLPGIGPKMANLILQVAFNMVDGVAVDIHVHRITNRLGWVKTKTPEETSLKLQELLPKDLWSKINPLLVGFGQTFCTAAGPGCPTCPVNKWCPTGISNLRNRK